jgi:hypothetical protein
VQGAAAVDPLPNSAAEDVPSPVDAEFPELVVSARSADIEEEEAKPEPPPLEDVKVEQKNEAKLVGEWSWIPLIILILSIILVWILKGGKSAATAAATLATDTGGVPTATPAPATPTVTT